METKMTTEPLGSMADSVAGQAVNREADRMGCKVAWQPRAKELLEIRIKQAQRDIEHYSTLLKMLPTELTWDQDRAVVAVLSIGGN